MTWPRLQGLKSQKELRPATVTHRSNSQHSSSSTGSSSSEVSSITSDDSNKTQTAHVFKVPKWAIVAKNIATQMLDPESVDGSNEGGNVQTSSAFKTHKWAFAAKTIANRIMDSGEDLVRKLPASKRVRGIHTPQVNGTPPVDNSEEERNTMTRNSSKTLCAEEDEPYDSLLNFTSPTPTWNTFDLNHLSQGENPEYPVFSGWAAFNGTHCPPRMVSATYWDDIVARNRQARLDKRATEAVTVVAEQERKREEPVHQAQAGAKAT